MPSLGTPAASVVVLLPLKAATAEYKTPDFVWSGILATNAQFDVEIVGLLPCSVSDEPEFTTVSLVMFVVPDSKVTSRLFVLLLVSVMILGENVVFLPPLPVWLE